MIPRSSVPLALVTVVGLAAVAPACSRTGLDLDEVTDSASLPCTPGTFDLTRAVPAVMFVLDRSGSMDQEFDQGESRWEVLTNALATTLPPVDASMEIGALLFPNGSDGTADALSCSLPATANLGLSTGHASSLVGLMQQTRPAGGTPTSAALTLAASVLTGVRAATSARAMVLATDGAPNCNGGLDSRSCICAETDTQCVDDPLECLDDARTVASIASYAAAGIPTYVIGIQDPFDTTLTAVLGEMAVAGGRPQAGAATTYYAATSEDDLDNALVAIRDQVGACTFLTTSVPGSQGSISVTLGGVLVPYDPTGTSGWSWGDKGNGEIVFAGAACTRVTASAGTSLTAQIACSVPDAGTDTR